MGVDLIVLTGNPGNGVSNELIVEALKEISAAVGDRVLLAAGKMHASGVAGEGGGSAGQLPVCSGPRHGPERLFLLHGRA